MKTLTERFEEEIAELRMEADRLAPPLEILDSIFYRIKSIASELSELAKKVDADPCFSCQCTRSHKEGLG